MSPRSRPAKVWLREPAAAGGRSSQIGHLTHHDAAGVWLNAQADNQGLTTFFPAHLILRMEMDLPNPIKADTHENP